MTTELFTNALREKEDIAIVAGAINRGWKIPEQVMEILPNHLARIALTSSDERAKASAAKLLVTMHGQNMKAAEGPKPGPTINVGVNVDARSDDRRTRILAIAERIRSDRILEDDSAE